MILFKVQKDKESLNPRVSKTSNGKSILLPKCAVCGSKKSRVIKEKEASDLLSRLGIKTPLSKIPCLGNNILIECNFIEFNFINVVLLNAIPSTP